jgi:hypothetical protein
MSYQGNIKDKMLKIIVMKEIILMIIQDLIL